LHQLLNTSSTFIWTKEESTHFAQLKDALCSSPVLHLPYLSLPFEIEFDASQYAIGVVLKQGGHPIAYHSETLSESKKNYSTYDKEFYSLVQALKHWRHYLLGKKPFCISTTTLLFSSTLNQIFRNKGTLNGPPTFNNFT
jgi:hypothetical protein